MRQHRAGRLAEAKRLYGQVLAVNPRHADSLHLLGAIAHHGGRNGRAADLIGRAIAIDARVARYHYSFGDVLAAQGRLDEAVACYRTAVDLRPDFWEAHNALGNTLQRRQRLDEAVACFRRAIELNPNFAELHSNLSTALRQQGRLEEAAASCRTAIALKPDLPEAHFNLAMALLPLGDLTAGWHEYEWRWRTQPLVAKRRRFARPQWRGEAAAGRTLLLHAEQGFGDTLQFCRYALPAAARGLQVVMEVQPTLVRLLRSLPRVDRVLAHGEALPDFDFHCPLLSMPLAVGTTLENIPTATAYLRPDPAQAEAWRTRLAAMAGRGLRIGLAWAGDPRPTDRAGSEVARRRSIAPERLAPLFEVRDARFFSLQKAGPPAPAAFPLTDFLHEMADFADTAALIANLDLVISVDTAMAHLAAALGRPVWLLDRHDPCWRWLAGRRDSPWYPTLRIYRQPQPGDWDTVLAELVLDLRALAAAARSR